MTDDRRLLNVFFEVQRGLPRQGPGCDESTLQALALCRLPERPAILEIGCGPGMQTVELAKLPVVASPLSTPARNICTNSPSAPRRPGSPTASTS